MASLQLHRNEPNEIYSKRTRKDKDIGSIPNLLAQFVEKWRLLKDGGMHQSVALSLARFSQRTLWLGNFHAIVSLLLHRNEPNEIYSGRTRKDEEIGPMPSLLD
jgi:hypothetical protein